MVYKCTFFLGGFISLNYLWEKRLLNGMCITYYGKTNSTSFNPSNVKYSYNAHFMRTCDKVNFFFNKLLFFFAA